MATSVCAGQRGMARSPGRLNCLVTLALTGRPRVPRGLCGRSLLHHPILLSSDEFYFMTDSHCDYVPSVFELLEFF